MPLSKQPQTNHEVKKCLKMSSNRYISHSVHFSLVTFFFW